MNRREFMAQLERLLNEIPENERLEALRFYNDYFDEAGPENEAQVIQDLGSPGRVAAVIRANLNGNRDQGEFTEHGYRDNVQEEDSSYPGTVRSAEKDCSGSWESGYRENSWEESDRSFGRGGKAGHTAYAHGTGDFGSQMPRPKRGAGSWALLIILLIFASPLLLGIGGSILGLVAGIAGVLLGILAVFGGGGIGLTAGGIVLFATSIPRLFFSPASGLVGMGGGLIFTALGILLLLAFAWLAFRLMPRIFRAVINFISRVAHRGRGGNEA